MLMSLGSLVTIVASFVPSFVKSIEEL